MARVRRTCLIGTVCLGVFAIIIPAMAKRAVPKPVAPVTAGGVTYSAPAELMGFVVATDARLHHEIWRERIFTVKFDPSRERDVQDVFITSLAVRGGALLITNERGERFSLDLSNRKVTRLT